MNMEWKCADQELPEMHKQTIDDVYGHAEFEESDPVLAYAPEVGMVVCVAEKSGGRVYWVDDVGKSYHVTHWVYLPEAPTA